MKTTATMKKSPPPTDTEIAKTLEAIAAQLDELHATLKRSRRRERRQNGDSRKANELYNVIHGVAEGLNEVEVSARLLRDQIARDAA